MFMFKDNQLPKGSTKNRKQKNHEVAPLSQERRAYIKNKAQRKAAVRIIQVLVLLGFAVFWEVGARIGIIDSFIMSQPSRILKTLMNLSQNGLFEHLQVTCFETLTGFFLGAIGGTCIAILLWWAPLLSKICDPFLVVLNSLPKIALGPIIIVWVGAGTKAIVFMAIAISMIVTVLEMLHGFVNTDGEMLKMIQTFGATRGQMFAKIVFPANISNLFNSLKVNIGLSLVGVIAGEFLVSRAGLGYLIVYGGQVFQLDLVMTSVIILAVVAALLYQAVVLLERIVQKFVSHTQ